ncbi:MAG: heavy metal translocating P-type ATPase [Acidimicrobiales bacterium]
MTCASCAARIERKLNAVDGVTAVVNYATERATVDYDPDMVSSEELVTAVRSAGYEADLPGTSDLDDDDGAAQRAQTALRRRLVVCAVVSLPVVLLAMVPALQFDGWAWVAGALSVPVVLWGGMPFHRAAWTTLKHRTATMDTLISLGSLAAFTWSVVALLFLGAGSPKMHMRLNMAGMAGMGSSRPVYFEVAATVVTLILLGRFLEARAKRRAGAALRALLALGAKDVAILTDNTGRAADTAAGAASPAHDGAGTDGGRGLELRIPIEQLSVGMRFVVRPGEKIATDGVVVEGRSAVDTSLVTGESNPREVGPGDAVVGATINVGGRLLVEATRVGADTALAQIGRLVVDAQTGKAPVQRLADRISSVFVPVVIAASLLTLAVWLLGGNSANKAFTAAVAVLIVACPCALGLATPTAILVASGRGAQLGMLIKGPEVLEQTRRIDTVLLDKTGTITTGTMGLRDITTISGTTRGEALRLVGSLEDASEHPVGRALASAAAAAGPLALATDFANHEGLGVSGVVEGREIVAGQAGFLQIRRIPVDRELQAAAAEAQSQGSTVVLAAWDGGARAMFSVADTLKPTSVEAVAELKALGLHPILLTGDNRATAAAVGDAVGIEAVVAQVLPAGKAAVVRDLQRDGHVVAMVGDGVNDAPALAQADLGIAVGTGTDVALEASDITIITGDLRFAADAIRLSRQSLRIIKGNLFWAFAYNVVAIPIAAVGLLNPMVAAGTMALSSVFVVTNSLRLRRFQPLHPAAAGPARQPVPSTSLTH